MTMNAISLQCPHCGQPLEAENVSRVFFCRPCRRGFTLDGGSLQGTPLHPLAPLRPMQAPAVYFPFWCIQGESRVEEGDATECAQQTFYVPAFLIRNINNFGDVGFFFSRRALTVQQGRFLDLPIFPAARALPQALAYPAVYVAAELAKTRDMDKVRVTVTPHKASLVLVVFYRLEEGFCDSLIGWKYPPGALL